MKSLSALRLWVAAAAAAFVIVLTSAASAQMKMAVVDVQRVVMETEDGLRAQATLKKLFDKRQQELDSRQNKLQQERDDIEKQSKVLSKEALGRRSEEWQRSRMELEAIFVEFNKELQKKQQEITQPIFNKVLTILRQIAAQDGYDAVFERNVVPYVRTDLDITDKVIQQYNAGSPKADKPATTTPSGKPPAKPPAPAPAPAPKK